MVSILITLAAALRSTRCHLRSFPQSRPPTVQVDCNYPGASAQVVAQTVATPIEQQVNGVEDMLYMSSQSTNDGSYTLTVTFKPGIDLNLAQVLVQNRVALAMPLLPEVVRQTGVNNSQAFARYSANGELELSGPPLRSIVSEQLRSDAGFATSWPVFRHQRSAGLRPARLQHAHLARSR